MCGICGTIPKKAMTLKDSSMVREMTAALFHRGPDGAGYFEDEHLSIGMRRLSIIDLEGGHQPLHNEDGSVTLVANGEIYNYIELREKLIARNHIFKTESDCETIVHAYEEYGNDFLSHLRGMFAFCLYDSKKQLVILARDRMGEKPLYIYESDGSVTFSSELKSLLCAIPRESRQIDSESIYLYFYYGYVPESRSIIRGIHQLPPGNYLEINLINNQSRQETYWEGDGDNPTRSSPVETIRKEIDHIEEIVIRSDVPVGISLSGGIDSSVVAVLAAKHSSAPLHAFSVGYPGYPANDERRAAERLARELGLIFHGVEVGENDFINDFEDMVAAMDDPIADIAAYGYYTVSRAAREAGVPVLLAGFGGDELFWGYEWTRDAASYNLMKKTIAGRLLLFGVLGKHYWRDLVRAPWAMATLIWQEITSKEIFLYELTPAWSYVRKNERAIFRKGFLESVDRQLPSSIQEYFSSETVGVSITRLLKNIWLTSNCINLGDRMSMAHSVELRLPLVDYRLYETVIGIRKAYPDDYRKGYKFWLIAATKDLLSSEIINRRKRGFTPPTVAWTTAVIDTYHELLKGGYLVSNGIVSAKFVNTALKNRRRHMKFLYAMVVFEVFSRHYLP